MDGSRWVAWLEISFCFINPQERLFTVFLVEHVYPTVLECTTILGEYKGRTYCEALVSIACHSISRPTRESQSGLPRGSPSTVLWQLARLIWPFGPWNLRKTSSGV